MSHHIWSGEEAECKSSQVVSSAYGISLPSIAEKRLYAESFYMVRLKRSELQV